MKKLYNSAWGIIHDSLRGIQALVARKLDSAIQQINRYPEDKYYNNQLRYPVDSNIYPVDSVIHLSSNWGQNGV